MISSMIRIIREEGYICINILGFKARFKNPMVSQLGDCCSLHGLQRLLDFEVNFPNPIGIVIARDVVIGKNCTIYQNVTIGKKKFGFIENKHTIIGDNVTICANACIIGDLNIGNNAIIEAGAVVLEDVPDNAYVAGNPAKVIEFMK